MNGDVQSCPAIITRMMAEERDRSSKDGHFVPDTAEQARRRFLFIRARPKAKTEGMVPFVMVVRLNGDWRRKG